MGELRKKYLSNRVIKVWNNLPTWIINAENADKFKTKIDMMLKNQPMILDYKTKTIDIGLLKRHAAKLEDERYVQIG